MAAITARVTRERFTGVFAGRDTSKVESIWVDSPIGRVLALTGTRKVTIERTHEIITYELVNEQDGDR